MRKSEIYLTLLLYLWHYEYITDRLAAKNDREIFQACMASLQILSFLGR